MARAILTGDRASLKPDVFRVDVIVSVPAAVLVMAAKASGLGAVAVRHADAPYTRTDH